MIPDRRMKSFYAKLALGRTEAWPGLDQGPWMHRLTFWWWFWWWWFGWFDLTDEFIFCR